MIGSKQAVFDSTGPGRMKNVCIKVCRVGMRSSLCETPHFGIKLRIRNMIYDCNAVLLCSYRFIILRN